MVRSSSLTHSAANAAEEAPMEANEVREAILLSALFSQRVVALLKRGMVADALQDAGHAAAIGAQLTTFLCSQERVEI